MPIRMAAARRRAHSERMRVLVVDDSERVRRTLAERLREHGMNVDTAADGAEALSYIDSLQIDVVVLDLMMPGMDGIQILNLLRERYAKPRILVLSARDQLQDRVDALNLGADDYLVKPFAFEEVLARVNALSRRRVGDASPVLSHGRLQLDTAGEVAFVDGVALPLTPKEYQLIELLVHHRGHVLSRGEIFDQLYDSTSSVSDVVIEVLMSTLRAKLAKAGLPDPIETRRGFGYVVV